MILFMNFPIATTLHMEPQVMLIFCVLPSNWKTMLVRTVADGGESYYVRGEHADTIPQLWTGLKQLDRG